MDTLVRDARPLTHAPRSGLGQRLLSAAIWVVLLVVPAVVTVLRYTDSHLNADGVEQSTMSIQHPELFYWGQDRLFPLVSWVASPVADPTANLWLCLTLQSLCFYGLLLLIAQRTASALRLSQRPAARGEVVVHYLALVTVANATMVSSIMHSYAIEGQPYALSWLLVGLAYEGWRRGGTVRLVLAGTASFVAMGINPSVVLLAGFLAVTDVLRRRRLLRWVGFVAMMAAMFVVWSALSTRYGGLPTPARDTEAPEYLSFSLDQFGSGLGLSLQSVISTLRPVPLVAFALLALTALTVVDDRVRARLTQYGAFFVGFALLFAALFAGNPWVLMNGYHPRYFFPLSLLVLMATAAPIAAGALSVLAGLAARARGRHVGDANRELGSGHRLVLVLAIGLAIAAAAAFVGPVAQPQNAEVFKQSAATVAFAEDHGVRFISGGYWNMWPVMHGLLDRGRDGVFVAGFKSGGDKADYRTALRSELDRTGSAQALCVNQDPGICANYLDFWTEPGWGPVEGRSGRCPAPPIIGVPDPGASSEPTCRVLQISTESESDR